MIKNLERENNMNKKLTIFAVIAIVAGLILPRSAVAASCGDGVAVCVCGDTVVADTTLVADLTCSGPGLIIGADKVKVDLNGYTLTGSASDLGMDNTGGFEKMHVKNGTIIGFETAVRVEGGANIKLDHLVISGDRTNHAIDILDSSKVSIKNSSITVTIPSSDFWFAEAIRLESDDDVKVDNVDVHGGFIGVNFACGDCNGGEVPTNGKIEHSTFTGQIIGILISNSTKAEVKENHVSGSVNQTSPFEIGSKGISIDSDFGSGNVVTGTKVKNNHVHDNEGIGIRVKAGDSTTTSGIEVKGNLVRDNDSDGILLVDADASKIKDNMVNHNGGDGISLTVGSTGNEIKNNGSTGNGDTDMVHDGTSTGNTWTGNTCGTSAPALGEVDCP